MTDVRKADFYYGSLLSILINQHKDPRVFEKGEHRRIYAISRAESTGEKLWIYTKYKSEPSENQTHQTKTWTFRFSPDEINAILQLYTAGEEDRYAFALICAKYDCFQESEIALLTFQQVIDCLGLEGVEVSPPRIAIRTRKGRRGLQAYGSGRDVAEALMISRDAVERL
ncbi:hypothetical protein B0H94_10699 [Salsuginibacillus halophilus]|uniref:Uncharacterized protein n=1 Tax=Salsuginibacillus halophilus TaxID=517424 RepID=A0A2P8HHY7_9BACI|nr:hypothetical protein [Salsuginibacillus halophilus]PSL45844.1 hypothetical protein B0H94_10699 [Salsuginibacillus halophilus]